MPSFFQTLKRLIPAKDIDHHESDLYVRDSPVVRTVIRQFGMNSSNFTSSDGSKWIDVPFAYEPFWDKKRRDAKRRNK